MTVKYNKNAFKIHSCRHEPISIFLPGDGYIADYHNIKRQNEQINAGFEFKAQSSGKLPRITGTFLYAHAPNYTGGNSINYSVDDWKDFLRQLKSWGIDTVLFQAVGWLELNEMYYRTDIIPDAKRFAVVEKLLEANEDIGLTLYMGGLGTAGLWREDITRNETEEIIKLYLDISKELLALDGQIHGFYISPETAYPGQRRPDREKLYNFFYKSICGGLKELRPDYPVIMSPGTRAVEQEDSQNAFDFLHNMLCGVPVDILAAQDSIGTMSNQLPFLENSFKIWQDVAKEIKAKMWANVELFERCGAGTENDSVAADFERVQKQIAVESTFAEKLICWEMQYYFSDHAGQKAKQLRESYLEYYE